ncbi:MAG: hypothetical protein QM811_27185 [Pirellulales bacterium]
MLQHRAPKDSKGNMVATSNFVNVTGGLLAILMFYFVTFVFQKSQGNEYRAATVSDNDLPAYVAQLERHESIPRMLFLFAAGTTLCVLIAFQRLRPDFLLRTLSFLRSPARRSLRAVVRTICRRTVRCWSSRTRGRWPIGSASSRWSIARRSSPGVRNRATTRC